MKKTVLRSFLFPTVILILLPLFVCLIYNIAAKQHSRERAEDEAQFLLQQVERFSERTTSRIENKDSSHGAPLDLDNFLQSVGFFVNVNSSPAKLLILTEDHSILFPRKEENRIASLPLAELCAAAIEDDKNIFHTDTGEEYIVQDTILEGLDDSPYYLVTYCSTEHIGTWVWNTSLHVLIVTFCLSLLVVIVLWHSVQHISQPLKKLCSEADRIGRGSFSPIEPEFSLQEAEELRQAMNDMALQLDHSQKEKTALLENLSHGMRTPLMSIAGYAQGIKYGVFTDLDKTTDIILNESERMKKILSDLLTLARLESPKAELPMGSLSLSESARRCLDRAEGPAAQKGVALQAVFPEEDATVVGNADLLEIILDNLLSNAVRYAKSSVTLNILLHATEAVVTVCDDGPGISSEDLPRIFERFYTGENGQFGLGLPICKSAIEVMSGTITAANSPQGGALFTLALPRG